MSTPIEIVREYRLWQRRPVMVCGYTWNEPPHTREEYDAALASVLADAEPRTQTRSDRASHQATQAIALEEMRVGQEVRQDMALDLLQAEPRFRSALAAARRASSYEWPARREQLVQDFVLRLVDAGLSGRTIEHYRAALADYLDG